MLVSAKEMLQKAKAGKYAVGQFNINNLEWTKAILQTAQELNSPVILGVSEGAGKYMCGYKTVVGMVKGMIEELGITDEEIESLNMAGYMPLTKHAAEVLGKRTDIVESISLVTEADDKEIYPLNGNMHWTRDNYGPVWIPKKGESINLTLDNIAIYERPIRVYEKNDLQIKDGKIFINGTATDSYTFKMDYYWMMGDNRHNSADSRFWGFVPEDHIVGKASFIAFSMGEEGIRWNRLFRKIR